MRLTVLGSSPSFPNPGGACSGYLWQQDDTQILVECGHGVASILLTVISLDRLSGIVISHMHPDHFFDLVPLHYALIFTSPAAILVPLWLPPGGVAVLERLQTALELSSSFFADCFAVEEFEPDDDLTIGDLRLSFAPTRHFVPGFAVRGEPTAGGSSLGYSGDTAPSETVRALLADVDLALIEATVLSYEYAGDAEGHLTPELAGKLAREAGAKRLLLTHYAKQNADAMLEAATRTFSGPVDLARQGETYQV